MPGVKRFRVAFGLRGSADGIDAGLVCLPGFFGEPGGLVIAGAQLRQVPRGRTGDLLDLADAVVGVLLPGLQFGECLLEAVDAEQAAQMLPQVQGACVGVWLVPSPEHGEPGEEGRVCPERAADGRADLSSGNLIPVDGRGHRRRGVPAEPPRELPGDRQCPPVGQDHLDRRRRRHGAKPDGVHRPAPGVAVQRPGRALDERRLPDAVARDDKRRARLQIQRDLLICAPVRQGESPDHRRDPLSRAVTPSAAGAPATTDSIRARMPSTAVSSRAV